MFFLLLFLIVEKGQSVTGLQTLLTAKSSVYNNCAPFCDCKTFGRDVCESCAITNYNALFRCEVPVPPTTLKCPCDLYVPHILVIAQTQVYDISLNESISPSFSYNKNLDWKELSVYGVGRLIGQNFAACGNNGTFKNQHFRCMSRPIGALSSANDVNLTSLFNVSMPRFKHAGASVMVKNRLWVTGGISSGKGETSFWNENGTWTTEGPLLPEPLMNHCAVQVDPVTSFIIGGISRANHANHAPSSKVFKFDWNTQVWTQMASMKTARGRHQCWLVTDPSTGKPFIIAAGGTPELNVTIGTTSVEQYDIQHNSWSDTTPLPHLRTLGTAVSVGNRHLWIPGWSGSGEMLNSVSPVVLEFNFVTGWSVFPSPNFLSTVSVPVAIPYTV